MKILRLFILPAALAFAHAGIAETGYIFSVDSKTVFGEGSTIYFNHSNSAKKSASPAEYGSNKAEAMEQKYELLLAKNGTISIFGNTPGGRLSVSTYAPERRSIEVSGEKINITPLEAASLAEYMSPAAILYKAAHLDAFKNDLRKLNPGGGKELKISEDSIQYCDNSLSYAIGLSGGKMASADLREAKSGKKFLELSLEYDGEDAFPSNGVIRMYSPASGKLQSTESFRVKLTKEIADIEKYGLFDISGGGKFKITDSRVRPYKTYEYSGGIPSVQEAEKLPSAEASSGSPQKKSPYQRKIEKFFTSEGK